MQLQVIWNLVLQPDSEGPTLISHAAWRSRTLLKSSSHTFVAHSRRISANSGRLRRPRRTSVRCGLHNAPAYRAWRGLMSAAARRATTADCLSMWVAPERIFRPGMLGIAASKVLPHLMVGGRPEAAQVIGNLYGPIVRPQ